MEPPPAEIDLPFRDLHSLFLTEIGLAELCSDINEAFYALAHAAAIVSGIATTQRSKVRHGKDFTQNRLNLLTINPGSHSENWLEVSANVLRLAQKDHEDLSEVYTPAATKEAYQIEARYLASTKATFEGPKEGIISRQHRAVFMSGSSPELMPKNFMLGSEGLTRDRPLAEKFCKPTVLLEGTHLETLVPHLYSIHENSPLLLLKPAAIHSEDDLVFQLQSLAKGTTLVPRATGDRPTATRAAILLELSKENTTALIETEGVQALMREMVFMADHNTKRFPFSTDHTKGIETSCFFSKFESIVETSLSSRYAAHDVLNLYHEELTREAVTQFRLYRRWLVENDQSGFLNTPGHQALFPSLVHLIHRLTPEKYAVESRRNIIKITTEIAWVIARNSESNQIHFFTMRAWRRRLAQAAQLCTKLELRKAFTVRDITRKYHSIHASQLNPLLNLLKTLGGVSEQNGRFTLRRKDMAERLKSLEEQPPPLEFLETLKPRTIIK
jgi:hypothetical protein